MLAVSDSAPSYLGSGHSTTSPSSLDEVIITLLLTYTVLSAH